MKNVKRKIAAIIAAATMGVSIIGGTCMSASAANASLTINSSSATLYNTSGSTRCGTVNFIVINRATGSQVSSASDTGNISNGSSRTASKSGYSVETYRFKASATLYKGTSVNSGTLWNGTKEY
jgi:hypothetical protein